MYLFFLSRGHAVAAACSLTEVFLEQGSTQPVERLPITTEGPLLCPRQPRYCISRQRLVHASGEKKNAEERMFVAPMSRPPKKGLAEDEAGERC